MEEAVDDFVEGTVAADSDHDRARLPDRPLRDLGRFDRAGRERRFVWKAGGGEPVADRGPLPSCLPRT